MDFEIRVIESEHGGTDTAQVQPPPVTVSLIVLKWAVVLNGERIGTLTDVPSGTGWLAKSLTLAEGPQLHAYAPVRAEALRMVVAHHLAPRSDGRDDG